MDRENHHSSHLTSRTFLRERLQIVLRHLITLDLGDRVPKILKQEESDCAKRKQKQGINSGCEKSTKGCIGIKGIARDVNE